MRKNKAQFERYLGLRISEEIYSLLTAHAAEHNMSVSAFARQTLTDAANQEICTWSTQGNTSVKTIGGVFQMACGPVSQVSHVEAAS